MATSCMLPNPMACCASCDVTQAPDTLRDVIPLTDALRDVITLSSHCHNLMPPPSTTSYPPPPTPLTRMGVTQQHDRPPEGFSSPPSPRLRTPSPSRMPRHVPSSRPAGTSAPGVAVVPKSFDCSGELPLLKVPSTDLRYRGEGAEHIVLRVLTTGQVVRLRKTSVRAVTSTANLVLRAKKDEEFLCNVARPILGPLLTDESRLLQLESETVKELQDSIGPEREVKRRHKEINSEGVACICSDAASVFIRRKASSLSSSPASSISSSSVSLSSSSSSSIDELPVSPSSSSKTSCDQALGQGHERKKHCSWQDVPKGSSSREKIISGESAQEAVSGQNLSTSQQFSTSSSHSPGNERCSNHSPREGRCSSSGVVLGNALLKDKQPGTQEGSFNTVPARSVSVVPQNICIEIKPKQGFIDTSTPDLPLCRYCVKQYIKVGKDTDQTTSRYCPLDLFSGNLSRMRKAVEGLLESPQNNLKVFVNGESVADCLSFRYLRDVIIAALTYDFTTAKTDLNVDGYLSPWSPLGRTLAFQTLDKLGVFNAVSLYSQLVKVIGQAKNADSLLQDLKCWTGDSQFCQSDNKLCTRCTQDDRQQAGNFVGDSTSGNQVVSSVEGREHLINGNLSNIITESSIDNGTNETSANVKLKDSEGSVELKDGGKHRTTVNTPSDFMQDDVIRKLQEYLLSTTAKDLSLMILLSGPYSNTPAPTNSVNSSPFIIEIEPGVWYQCQVTGVDLVAKPPSKILKHEKDYMRLKTVLEGLKRKGKEPTCCRQ